MTPFSTKTNSSALLLGDAFAHLQGIHAQLAAHTVHLEKLVEEAKVQMEADDFKWIRGSGTCDANGNATISLENRTGFEAELVSWATVGAATSNGGIVFYFNSVEAPNMIWSASVTQYGSNSFPKGSIIPVNGVLVAQFYAMGNASSVWANVLTRRVAKRQSDPYNAGPRGW